MKYQLRQHQIDAVSSINDNLRKGKKNVLVQMSIGSGMTITCLAAIDELWKHFSWDSILILSDRKLIVEQILHVKKEFFNDSLNNKDLKVVTTNYYIKNDIDSEVIILYDLHFNDKLLSFYLNEFKGIIIHFSSNINLFSNDLLNIKPEIIYKYSIQNVIENFQNHSGYKTINEITNILHNILSTINSDISRFKPEQLQKIAINHREIEQYLEQLTFDFSENERLLSEVLEHKLSIEDVKEIGNRKKQLEKFDRLLNDSDYFNSEKNILNRGSEFVWQTFFENNSWILGYGINQIFYSSLTDKKLEQTVSGYEINSSGKRIDALMKSKGFIENLCFVELKTHETLLINPTQYRKECFSPSQEVVGAIAQIQKTVSKSEKLLREKLDIVDDCGDPTGEVVFNCKPKSYLIIGSLKEFETPLGINGHKYSSFEIFRKSINNVEIITFDELYEKAKFITLYE